MNIRPLFVHFPIGIFAAYTLFELLPYLIRPLREATWIRPAKIWLVVLGVLSFFFVFPTGEIAEGLLDKNSDATRIVETHALYGGLTLIIYALIALSYIVVEHTAGRLEFKSIFAKISPLLRRLTSLARFFVETNVRFLLLFIGIVLITITGALGAAMVYGPNVEPLVTYIYNALI